MSAGGDEYCAIELVPDIADALYCPPNPAHFFNGRTI